MLFDGDGEKCELFKAKLIGHLRRMRIHKMILPTNEGGDANVSDEDNAEVYAELIQCLDDVSLNLIFRYAKDIKTEKRSASCEVTTCHLRSHV